MTKVATPYLTDQQRAFASSYVLGETGTAGNGTASAIAAGYGEKYARQEAYRLLRHDGVRAEIDRLTREALGDHAVAAVSLLGRVINDEQAPIKVRVDAAKTVLDRAGYIAPKAEEPDRPGNEKPLTEMSLEELISRADKLRDELERSKHQRAPDSGSQEVH